MSRSKRNALARLDRLGITPMALTAVEAAAYLNLSEGTFRAKVKAGIIPGPIPGISRWDKRVLDKWMGAEAPPLIDRIEEKLRASYGKA